MGGKKARVGDIFAIPLDHDHAGYGQIVFDLGQGHYYVAVFAEAHPRTGEPDTATVLAGELAFLPLTLDALLHNGRWPIVGNAPVDVARLPWPAYKEGVSPGVFDVVDYAGHRRRRATAAEAQALPYRTVVAPIRVETALRAVHGLEDWRDAYDDLRPPPQAQTSDAVLSR
jgi:hypothetical protein